MRLLFRAHLLFTGGKSLDSICVWYHPRLSKNTSYEQRWVSFIGLEYVKNLLNRDVLPFQNRHHFCPEGICGFLFSTLLQWLASLANSHSRVCWSWGEFPGQCSVGSFQGGALGKIPAGADHLDGLPPARAWAQNCEFLEGLRIPSPCWPDIFFLL